MGIRFITPESIRLPISGGEFIVIKKRLSHGERDDMMTTLAPHMTPGKDITVATKSARAIAVASYLIGWSSPVPMSPSLSMQERIDTLNGLDPDDFDEIERALNDHVTIEAASKNETGGASASVPSFASVGP